MLNQHTAFSHLTDAFLFACVQQSVKTRIDLLMISEMYSMEFTSLLLPLILQISKVQRVSSLETAFELALYIEK